jgi:hypothetical protein
MLQVSNGCLLLVASVLMLLSCGVNAQQQGPGHVVHLDHATFEKRTQAATGQTTGIW